MFKEIYEEDYNKLKNKGIDDKTIFTVAYIERKDREAKTLRNKIGILHIDNPSRFHFSFLNDPTIFNLELIDPNMKPITINNLPENGRIVDEDYGAIFIMISNAVHLWENNATDQKMTCNIHVYVSVTRDW
jgi:hypothetical protein